MRKKFLFLSSLSVIILTLLFFIGCGGGGGGSTGGTSPTNTSTSTTGHSNQYKVLYGTKGTKATGLIIVLPVEVDTPSGYSAAGGASVSFKNSSGVVVTSAVGSDGVFNAKDMGIPVIKDSSDIDDVTTVDVTYNDDEETNIPIPVFDEDTTDDGTYTYIKIIPGAGLIKINGEQAFYCIGINSQGYLSTVKNVSWAVSDESTIAIKSVSEDGSVCTVQGIKGGDFPEIAYADLTATVEGTTTPTATATATVEPTATQTTTPEGAKTTLTDTASVGVIAIPEEDAVISGTLLDKDGSPIPNARLIFRSAESETSDNAFSFYMAYSAETDENGSFTATLTSGESYSVVACVNEEIIIPTSTWFTSRLSFTYMNAYTTVPETFGPVESGNTVVDLTLGEAIGTNPWPNPTPTYTSVPTPDPTATATANPTATPTYVMPSYSPIPWPTYTAIPYPTYTPDPYPTGLWNSGK